MDDWMDSLIEEIAAFDRAFPSRIRGASDREIGELEALIGQPLPANYRSYLARMGHDSGGLYWVESDETKEIAGIVESYQEILAGEWSLPPDSILICNDIFPSLNLVLQQREGETPVLMSEGEWDIRYYAASLEGLLFRQGFLLYRLKSLGYYGFWTSARKNLLEIAATLAGDLGFERLWFSDRIVYCGDRDDALIAITQYEKDGCGIYLSARERSPHEKLGEILVNQLQVKPVTVSAGAGEKG